MNAAKQMEAFCDNAKGLAFRIRLSGVVFKPPYAADNGNMSVVSDKENPELKSGRCLPKS
jgi:hypothetical protein